MTNIEDKHMDELFAKSGVADEYRMQYESGYRAAKDGMSSSRFILRTCCYADDLRNAGLKGFDDGFRERMEAIYESNDND